MNRGFWLWGFLVFCFFKLGEITARLFSDGTDPAGSVLKGLNYFQKKSRIFGG